MSSYTRQQLETWLKTIEIDVPSKILDVGGSQKPVKPRLTRGELFEFTILDLENPHEGSANPDIIWDLNGKFNPEGFDTLDVNIVNGDMVPKEFDIVFCLEVAEYWWNPYQALRNINWLLKKGGILYISVPFVYPVHNPYECDYLRYTERGIHILLKKTGFKTEEIYERKSKSDGLEAFYSMEGMKPSRGYGSHSAVGWLIKAVKV